MILSLIVPWKKHAAGDIIELPTADGRRMIELAMARTPTIKEVMASEKAKEEARNVPDVVRLKQETQEVAPRPKAKKKKKAKKKTVIPAGERSS